MQNAPQNWQQRNGDILRSFFSSANLWDKVGQQNQPHTSKLAGAHRSEQVAGGVVVCACVFSYQVASSRENTPSAFLGQVREGNSPSDAHVVGAGMM